MNRTLLVLLMSSFTFGGDWQNAIIDLTQDAKKLWREEGSIDTAEHNGSQSYKRQREEHFNLIWEDVIKNLENGLTISEEIQKAPNFAIFNDDKKSLRKKFDMTLDQIINLLLDDQLLNYRKKIRDAEESITQKQNDILTYREKKIVAPTEGTLHTTKEQYDEKIAEAKDYIAGQKSNITTIKLEMSKNFQDIGIFLSPEQIDVLLARIDGDDIIQMTLVLDVLKKITQQLVDIMKESGEELGEAKKYYGMHMVLLELVVYIQDKFTSNIQSIYLPKIDTIIEQTKKMIIQTDTQISNEENLQRRNIYSQNYESQKLTLKTALVYRKNLADQLTQIIEAKEVSRKNLALSQNTYQTVTLSSDLFKVISSSQEMMQAVMKLQIPTIIPFENLQMKNKYQELTKQLKSEKND